MQAICGSGDEKNSRPAGGERPEYANLLRFAARAGDAPLEACVPHVHALLRRAAGAGAPELARCLAGEETPLVLSDAVLAWPALRLWSFEWLREQCGGVPLLVNDRAPARRTDTLAGAGGQQRSARVSLAAYADYVLGLPRSLAGALAAAGGNAAAAAAPFYANGWRAFMDAPALAADCPPPDALTALDDTRALLAALEAALVGGAGRGAAPPGWGDTADALTKCFLGPAGTITRLHCDAADAHGWLAQVMGRKLVVLLPPADTAYLYPLAGEAGARQSPVDVLDADVLARWPLYARARPHAAVLVPGEALLVPAGWWHYAAALEPSITVIHNFYHGPSNAGGLAGLVRSAAAACGGSAAA